MSIYKQSIETKTAFLGGKIKGKFLQRTEKPQMHAVLHLGIKVLCCPFHLFLSLYSGIMGNFSRILNFSIPFKFLGRSILFLIIKTNTK